MPGVSDPAFPVASVKSNGESHIMFDLADQGGTILNLKVLFVIMTLGHKFSSHK